ncbi:unnamed protein product [Porites evermanni]|uniref:Uncharacterized protein n=1 Tax=Porites evermanni TaxID=104178 RepID=A0ABN8LIS3_9CNID|nr:unnamed protein product [Porites evermanni]
MADMIKLLLLLMVMFFEDVKGRPPPKVISNEIKHRTTLSFVTVPVLKDAHGVPHETTAQEDQKSYLTGPAYRILNKDNTFDTKDPLIFFPLVSVEHPRG